MQSILSTTPSSTTKSDGSNETKLGKEVENSEGKGDLEKNTGSFGEVLENTIKEKSEYIEDKKSSVKENAEDLDLALVLSDDELINKENTTVIDTDNELQEDIKVVSDPSGVSTSIFLTNEVAKEDSFIENDSLQENAEEVPLSPDASNVSESSIGASEPSIDVSESSIGASEPSIDVSESSIDVSESSIDVSESSVDVSESSVDVSESSIDVSNKSINAGEDSQSPKEIPKNESSEKVSESTEITNKISTEESQLVINQFSEGADLNKKNNPAELSITESSDEDNNGEQLDSEFEINESIVSPMITQIENAQNMATNVNDTSEKKVTSEARMTIEGMKKVGSKTSNELEKFEKKIFEHALAKNAEESGEADDFKKELIGKSNLPTNEKLDNILPSLKTDINKSVINQNIESNILNAPGLFTASADKSISHMTSLSNGLTANPVLQSTALHQSIELQAKNASVMVGERILMMLGQGKQEVTIRLDPAELGSMHIKLQVQHDQVQVAIQTQVGQSRDIIEQNLPRLREQLAQQGINLGETSVEQHSGQNQSNSKDSQHANDASLSSNNMDEAFLDDQSKLLVTQIPLPAQGIDYYA